MHFSSTHGCLNATAPALALVSGVTAAPTDPLLIAVFKRLSADRRKNDTDAVEATLMPLGRFLPLLLLPYRSPYRLRSLSRAQNIKPQNIKHLRPFAYLLLSRCLFSQLANLLQCPREALVGHRTKPEVEAEEQGDI